MFTEPVSIRSFQQQVSLEIYIFCALFNTLQLLNHTEYNHYVSTGKLIHNTCTLNRHEWVTETVCDINHAKYKLRPSTQNRKYYVCNQVLITEK